jgi:hypothetical protein
MEPLERQFRKQSELRAVPRRRLECGEPAGHIRLFSDVRPLLDQRNAHP